MIKLAKKCTINLKQYPDKRLILSLLTYATRKLWNVANYERKQWNKASGLPYPNWYDQKKRLKTHFWYKNLPSQSAQELLAVLDRSWKSFYKLKKTGGIENPKPPGYKQKNYNISFLNNGFRILPGNKVRLSLPRQLKKYLKEKHDIQAEYLIVDVPNHLQLESHAVKIIEIKSLPNGKFELFFVIEVPDTEPGKIDYRKFLAIDIGVNNFLSCYIYNGTNVIYSGRQLLSINRYFDKTISCYQSISDAQQSSQDIKYPKQTRKVEMLYDKRRKQLEHLLHCMTRNVIAMAIANDVDVIFVGDITGIRKNVNFGRKTNQKFHKLPYKKVINQLKYKAQLVGIEVLDNIREEYTSQTCCICKDTPSKANAVKSNRKHRGLYVCRDCGAVLNADINGAVNISKKYLESLGLEKPVVALGRPVMYRFNGLKFVA